MNRQNQIILGIVVIVAVFAIAFWPRHKNSPSSSETTQTNTSQSASQSPPQNLSELADPISNAASRVTKKPFGIYVTPTDSPVSPEHFTGYHTGTDFETTPAEANTLVPFYAICSGKILVKETTTGYGGVLVESCTINNQAVTIIYGHLSLKSIAKNVGDTLAKGEQIGDLGQPPTETDGERKHLHLGIHIGTAVNILGYVQKQSDLSGWLDWQKITGE